MSISPHLHLHFEFQHSCNNPICCIQQEEDRRVINVEENRPSAPVRVWRAFKQSCCCCCNTVDPEEQNERVLDRYEELMVKQFGELPVKTAYELANIDVERKREEKSPLYERDVRKILQKAQFIQENIQELDQMVAQARHAAPTPRGELEHVITEMPIDQEVIPLDEAVNKNKSAFFSSFMEIEEANLEEIVQTELKLVPAKEELAEDVVRTIAGAVEDAIKEKHIAKVNRLAVRRIISKNIREKGVETEEPDFLKDVDPETREALKERFNVEALTPRECAALVKALKKKKKRSPQIEEVDQPLTPKASAALKKEKKGSPQIEEVDRPLTPKASPVFRKEKKPSPKIDEVD